MDSTHFWVMFVVWLNFKSPIAGYVLKIRKTCWFLQIQKCDPLFQYQDSLFTFPNCIENSWYFNRNRSKKNFAALIKLFSLQHTLNNSREHLLWTFSSKDFTFFPERTWEWKVFHNLFIFSIFRIFLVVYMHTLCCNFFVMCTISKFRIREKKTLAWLFNFCVVAEQKRKSFHLYFMRKFLGLKYF